jgi:hypothetical protein
MHVLHMEHRVPNYEAWKQHGFDSDPIGRQRMGVTGYRIGRGADDPNNVTIEFADAAAASRMAEALTTMWVGAQARGLIETPVLTSFEVVESAEL